MFDDGDSIALFSRRVNRYSFYMQADCCDTQEIMRGKLHFAIRPNGRGISDGIAERSAAKKRAGKTKKYDKIIKIKKRDTLVLSRLGKMQILLGKKAARLLIAQVLILVRIRRVNILLMLQCVLVMVEMLLVI